MSCAESGFIFFFPFIRAGVTARFSVHSPWPRLPAQRGAGEQDARTLTHETATVRALTQPSSMKPLQMGFGCKRGGIYQDFNSEIISKAHEALVSSCGIMAGGASLCSRPCGLLWLLSRSAGNPHPCCLATSSHLNAA